VPEYVRDRDGDVWEWDASGGVFRSSALYPRTRDELTADFGPISPCAADGRPLDSPDTVRALVAGAFLDYAERWEAEYARVPARHNPFAAVARETADAILRGDVQPAKAP
jgi:hypothetical protein